MLDFKKNQKELYQPKTVPSVVEVPEMTFIAISGKGDPNTSGEYSAAIELLYGLSYAIKMGNKHILEYIVAPLEGFWNVNFEYDADGKKKTDKSEFVWTALIRQPDFVTGQVFEIAKNVLKKKKPHLDVTKARLEKIAEGLCVQILHIGSYDDEPATIAVMDNFAAEKGYMIDLSEKRRHHEIYLNIPGKVATDKLKTIIRHPIKRKEDWI